MSHCIKCFTTEHESWLPRFCFHLFRSFRRLQGLVLAFPTLLCKHCTPRPESPWLCAGNHQGVRGESLRNVSLPVAVLPSQADRAAYTGGGQVFLGWASPGLPALLLPCFTLLSLRYRGPIWGNCIDKSTSTYRQHDNVIKIVKKIAIKGFFPGIFFYILLPESSLLVA